MTMSNRYKLLLQERADLVAEGKTLFAAAEAESRDLSEDEKKRDDAINARLQTIAGELEREERRREWERTVEAVPSAAGQRSPQITGMRDLAAERPFNSLGENLQEAVRFATTHQLSPSYQGYVAHVQQMYAATGLNENVGGEGGVLVMTDFVAGLLTPMHEEGPFTNRTRNIPVSADANGIVIKAVNETSRATGSRWGGVQGYRLAEAGTLTASKPSFRDMTLKLKKYGVLAYTTEELLRDSAALESVIGQAAGEELSFMANDDILNGNGAAGALGLMNAGALISVTKEAGQAAATVVNANLVKMWQRLHPRHRADAVWYINSEVEPQLDQLSIPAGAGALEPRYVTYGPDGVMRIKGRPVVVTEFNAALGTVGDIVLADLGDYVTIDKGGVQAASSIHVQFLTDEQVFRFIYRYDGQPALNAEITPYKGNNTQSAYVALETRS
jgi:HK97 family phage major capsid protein